MNKKLLLHSCCAPCSTAAWDQLKNIYDITFFWFNPNIYPTVEYEKRLKELRRFCSIVNIPLIESTANVNFDAAITGLEAEPEGGKRCGKCFEIRLRETARYANENGFSYFATTLTVSPHKNAKLINGIGKNIEVNNTKYLTTDLKKKGGYQKSIELCKEYNIYRQKYCGCKFSL
jgi:hypothetical protein